jgi:hypothetical protein
MRTKLLLIATFVITTIAAVYGACNGPEPWCPAGQIVKQTNTWYAWTCCDLVNLCPSGAPKRFVRSARECYYYDMFGDQVFCLDAGSVVDAYTPGDCCDIIPPPP